MEEVTAVHVAARDAAVRRGWMPPGIRSRADVRSWLAGRLAVDETWVAEAGGRAVAYARLTATWLDDLYVEPAAQRGGLGSALLELVKSLRPDGFGLWVFEVNAPARAFYASRGLVEAERTDGTGNEEREPDIRMEWSPT